MKDEFIVTCPYCGEQVDIYIEMMFGAHSSRTAKFAAIHGALTCRALTAIRFIEVSRADGSE